MEPGVRTHDKFYLKEDRKHTPKEYFKFVVDKLPFSLNNKKVLDVGCGDGTLMEYLKIPKGAKYKLRVVIELEGEEKPACLADCLALAYK